MKRGFTLAEILITLGVIGIVSALTLSTLIKNYQKQVTVNKLRVEYNKFANIINRSVSENGNISDWVAEFNDVSDLWQRSALITEKYILPYINGQTYKFGRYEYGTVYSLTATGTSFFTSYTSGTTYRTKNGTMFRISVMGDSLILLLDIDNKIRKNVVGKDVFMFSISTANNKNTFEPYGLGIPRDYLIGKDSDWVCKPPKCNTITYPLMSGACKKDVSDARYAGTYCTALIVHDGWKIKDDYPW